MSSLYELTKEFKEAEIALLDMDEQTVTDTLESLAMPIEEKAINVAKYIGNINAEADAIAEAIKLMQARLKAAKTKANNLTDYLHTNMLKCDIDRISCPYFELAVVKKPASVIIDGIVPSEFMVEKIVSSPDKKAIKAAIESGGVSFAHLEAGTRLRIK